MPKRFRVWRKGINFECFLLSLKSDNVRKEKKGSKRCVFKGGALGVRVFLLPPPPAQIKYIFRQMPHPRFKKKSIEFIYILFYLLFLVNCVVSQWSSCSKTCGTGSQQRSVQTPANYGGLQCPSQLTKSCNLENCPG